MIIAVARLPPRSTVRGDDDQLLAEFDTYPESGMETRVHLTENGDVSISYVSGAILNEPPYWDDRF